MIVPTIIQNPFRIAMGIFVLSRAQRVQEPTQPNTAKAQGNRDKIRQHIHFGFNLSAFNETAIDELDIASAAISGVASPATASGTAIRL